MRVSPERPGHGRVPGGPGTRPRKIRCPIVTGSAPRSLGRSVSRPPNPKPRGRCPEVPATSARAHRCRPVRQLSGTLRRPLRGWPYFSGRRNIRATSWGAMGPLEAEEAGPTREPEDLMVQFTEDNVGDLIIGREQHRAGGVQDRGIGFRGEDGVRTNQVESPRPRRVISARGRRRRWERHLDRVTDQRRVAHRADAEIVAREGAVEAGWATPACRYFFALAPTSIRSTTDADGRGERCS